MDSSLWLAINDLVNSILDFFGSLFVEPETVDMANRICDGLSRCLG
jgi:hypothetical protein